MNWLRDLGTLEYLFISLFGLLYISYAIKMYLLGRKLEIRVRRLTLKFLLRIAYLSLFIVSLLGPSFGDIKKEIKSIAREVYIAIDVSYSMDARDLSPSRMEKTKMELRSLVSSLASDRIGLLVFSSDCYWVCPPTYDKEAFLLYLNSVNTGMVSNHGSNLSSLSQCIFREPEHNDQSRIALIVSDGENFGSDPTELFQKLKEKKFNTFILGVGSENEVRIPEGERGWRKDKEGNEIITRFDHDLLKDMADIADGRYFELNESSGDIKSLISRINKIEGQVQASRKIDSVANKYFYFLFVGISLLIADILITVNAVKF